MKVLFLLICFHYLSDFALQNDFVAKFKAPGSAPFWPHVLFAHCVIQGLGVFLATNSITLGVLEILTHGAIDYAKCVGKISFNQDQILHITCKVIWFALLTKGLVS